MRVRASATWRHAPNRRRETRPRFRAEHEKLEDDGKGKEASGPAARPKVPMRRLVADCSASKEAGNARRAKGAGHCRETRVNRIIPGGARLFSGGGGERSVVPQCLTRDTRDSCRLAAPRKLEGCSSRNDPPPTRPANGHLHGGAAADDAGGCDRGVRAASANNEIKLIVISVSSPCRRCPRRPRSGASGPPIDVPLFF